MKKPSQRTPGRNTLRQWSQGRGWDMHPTSRESGGDIKTIQLLHDGKLGKVALAAAVPGSQCRRGQ